MNGLAFDYFTALRWSGSGTTVAEARELSADMVKVTLMAESARGGISITATS